MFTGGRGFDPWPSLSLSLSLALSPVFGRCSGVLLKTYVLQYYFRAEILAKCWSLGFADVGAERGVEKEDAVSDLRPALFLFTCFLLVLSWQAMRNRTREQNIPIWFPLRESPAGSFPTPGMVIPYLSHQQVGSWAAPKMPNSSSQL